MVRHEKVGKTDSIKHFKLFTELWPMPSRLDSQKESCVSLVSSGICVYVARVCAGEKILGELMRKPLT